MTPDPSSAQRERQRQQLRLIILLLALLLIALGFATLAVPANTAQEIAVNRGFLGVGLLILGFLLGLLSRVP